jgi:serine/threonine protein kinase
MNEHDLLAEAIKRTDPAERAAFLDQSCGRDSELRRRLVELLADNAQSGGTLDQAPTAPAEYTATADLSTPIATGEHGPDSETEALARPDPDATTARQSASPVAGAASVSTREGIGTVIAGRYTLVDVIGEGGMGSVYLASQTEPVKRQVALKLIKAGMDSRGVLARFDAERQALALMDHPNIARIYDGGVTGGRRVAGKEEKEAFPPSTHHAPPSTPPGQPFFVMELVQGVPLAEYCDQQRLTVRSRLELFVSVCQAVQHAHQKGIIHRDLKPGNVLVTEVDGRPTPKVIDFGVAKATEVKLTDMSFADVGAIVGTPAYMSPEQADPTSIDIDTRTDVYALGVMLYELLAGSPPIDTRQFQRGAILEMLRMVREVDPPRPSTKLSTAEALPNIAANRSIEPARLTKLLQGELDWVVMKALEKDRKRRYETANGFARDIQRYLADEVVEARPPSRSYRLKKFVKRNKGQVIAASLVLLTLVGGIVGTSLGMASAQRAQKEEAKQRGIANGQRDKAIAAEQQAGKERDKAIAAERQTATERDKALAAEAKTKTINEFLTNDLLTQAEPENNAVEDKVTLVEVLDRAAKKVGTRFADQPDLEWALRDTIANTYHGLASWEKAETQRRAMLDAARKRDPRSAQSYTSLGALAHILHHRGRRDAEVLDLAEEAAKGAERALGADHPDTGAMLNNLGILYKDAGKVLEAIELYEHLRDVMIAKSGPDHPSTLSVLDNLAGAYQAAGRLPEAISLGERVRDARIAEVGPDQLDTLTSIGNLASMYLDAGRVSEAIGLLERVRDAQISKLGPDHDSTLATLGNLARAYQAAGRLPEAIGLHERVRDARVAKLGPDHPNSVIAINNLVEAYEAAGRRDEPIAVLERLRDAQTVRLGPDHPLTLTTLNNIAAAYWRSKQLDKSVPLFEDLLKRREAKFGRQHMDTQRAVGNLGVNYKDVGRLKEAIPLLEEAYQASKRLPTLRGVHFPLVDAYRKAGEDAKLADLILELLPEARRMLPRDSPDLVGMLSELGLILVQQKKWIEAEPHLRECLAIREKQEPEDWRTFNTKSLLGGALLGQKKYAEAEPLLLSGYQGMKQREKTIPPPAASRLPEALDRLIDFYSATSKPNEVKKWQAERAKYPATAPPLGKK